MLSVQLLEMADFYADLAARWPPDDVAMQRDLAERLHMLATEPEGVTYAEADAGGVPALWAIPRDASPDHVLLHSHSGGSVVSSMYMDRKAVAHLAKATGVRALIINFRLAPEHKFPAQIDDVETAFDWLLAQGLDRSRIASIGHSIGGNYAINLALTLLRKGRPVPGAILSMSPWLDMDVKHVAIETHGHLDRQITRDQLLRFSALMLDGTGVSKADPRINLMHADPVGLPPTMIYYGDHEILSGDAIAFADRARAAGVEIDLRALAHGQHNFILGAGRVPEIDAAIAQMAAWLRVKLGLSSEAGPVVMSSALCLHDVLIPAFEGGFRSLSGLLDKAAACVASGRMTEAQVLDARLAPDMQPFRRQIQYASDTAKAAAMRLAGRSVPSIADTETTIAELRERIRKTEDILDGVTRADLSGSEDRTIKLNLGRNWVSFDGRSYLTEYALPNFFFHITAAYAILRHNGLEVGKLDYLVDLARRYSGASPTQPVHR